MGFTASERTDNFDELEKKHKMPIAVGYKKIKLSDIKKNRFYIL